MAGTPSIHRRGEGQKKPLEKDNFDPEKGVCVTSLVQDALDCILEAECWD